MSKPDGQCSGVSGNPPADVWNRHAGQWQLIGSPLRPSAPDIERYQQGVTAWQAGLPAGGAGRSPDVLLLGVTPEIANLHWPASANLLAADHSFAMLSTVWQGRSLRHVSAHGVCADWKRLPLADQSRDLVIGDGCFSMQVSQPSYRDFAASLARVLRPGGVFLIRLFLRPDQAELVAQVFADLEGGRIGVFHAFKWRLAQALQENIEQGVKLADIWAQWHANVPDPARLAAKLNWRPEIIATIDAYRGLDTRYSFPSLGEVRAIMAGAFRETGCHFPAYELGERCPIMIFQRI